jgi:hypothetical protein
MHYAKPTRAEGDAQSEWKNVYRTDEAKKFIPPGCGDDLKTVSLRAENLAIYLMKSYDV